MPRFSTLPRFDEIGAGNDLRLGDDVGGKPPLRVEVLAQEGAGGLDPFLRDTTPRIGPDWSLRLAPSRKAPKAAREERGPPAQDTTLSAGVLPGLVRPGARRSELPPCGPALARMSAQRPSLGHRIGPELPDRPWLELQQLLEGVGIPAEALLEDTDGLGVLQTSEDQLGFPARARSVS